MRFKIDVADSETGEVATVEVNAPTAQAARQYLRDAGYTIWATEPIASPQASESVAAPLQAMWNFNPPVQSMSQPQLLENQFAQQAEHARFRRHPIRFILWPILEYASILTIWLSLVVTIILGGIELPGWPWIAGRIFAIGAALGIVGLWIGKPVRRGRKAMRQWADMEIVCRYCHRRGAVRTYRRRRHWAHCYNCGVKWTM